MAVPCWVAGCCRAALSTAARDGVCEHGRGKEEVGAEQQLPAGTAAGSRERGRQAEGAVARNAVAGGIRAPRGHALQYSPLPLEQPLPGLLSPLQPMGCGAGMASTAGRAQMKRSSQPQSASELHPETR